jgi:tRNA uridine 5-carboxymethylaminomethyl modification enzyme
MEKILNQSLAREFRAMEMLRRPEITYHAMMSIEGVGPAVDDVKIAEQIEICAKYDGYVERSLAQIERQRRNEETSLPDDLNYLDIKSLSAEVREKLHKLRPVNIGQAARIPGITPAAVSILLVHLKKRSTVKNKSK